MVLDLPGDRPACWRGGVVLVLRITLGEQTLLDTSRAGTLVGPRVCWLAFAPGTQMTGTKVLISKHITRPLRLTVNLAYKIFF